MKSLLNRNQLARLEATLYQVDDIDYFYRCHGLVSISPHNVVQLIHMRITNNTIMFQHNAGIELYGNAAFLKQISDILGIKFSFRDKWGPDYVEIEAV
jgi:hypothetical protein